MTMPGRRPYGARAKLCSLVFPAGGDAAPDVAFGLVLVQHGLDLGVQRPVQPGQAVLEVLMYREQYWCRWL